MERISHLFYHEEGTFQSRNLLCASGLIALTLLSMLLGVQAAYSQEQSSSVSQTRDECSLIPIKVPTLPHIIPGYAELDPETQLHVTGKAQVFTLENYRLEIAGKVKRPLELHYDDVRCLPRIESHPTLVCPGFFEDTATWAGASLAAVLELAGLNDKATHLRLVSADGYATLVEIKQALLENNFLAYELEGQPIPVLHGFPIRAVFPDLKGNKWVKWLVRIEVQ